MLLEFIKILGEIYGFERAPVSLLTAAAQANQTTTPIAFLDNNEAVPHQSESSNYVHTLGALMPIVWSFLHEKKLQGVVVL